MKIKKLLFIIILIGFIFPAHYTVRYLSGDVKLKNKDFAEGRRLHYMEKVHPGDTIITGPSSFAALRSLDGSVIKITANTRFKIQTMSSTAKTRKQNFMLTKGKIFASLSKLKKQSDIKFTTPTAVAGIRGTVIILDVNEQGATSLFVNEGRVAFGRSKAALDTMVKANEMVTINQSGKKMKKAIKPADRENAEKGIPVAVATMQTRKAKLKQDVEARLKKQLKNELKQNMALQKQQMNQVRGRSKEKMQWDIETGRVFGKYRVRQLFKMENDNAVRFINITKNTASGQISFIDVIYKAGLAIPQGSSLLTDSSVEKMNFKKNSSMITRIGSKKGADTDLFSIYYDSQKGAANLAFNGETVYQTVSPEKDEGNWSAYVILTFANEDEYKKYEQNENYEAIRFRLQANIVELNDNLTVVTEKNFEEITKGANLVSLITDLGLKAGITSPSGHLRTGEINIIVTTDLLMAMAMKALTEE